MIIFANICKEVRCFNEGRARFDELRNPKAVLTRAETMPVRVSPVPLMASMTSWDGPSTRNSSPSLDQFFQKDIFNIPPGIYDRENIDLMFHNSVDPPPWRNNQFPVLRYALVL